MASLKRDGKYVIEEIKRIVLSELDKNPTIDDVGSIVNLLNKTYQLPDHEILVALRQLREDGEIDLIQEKQKKPSIQAVLPVQGVSWFIKTYSGRESLSVLIILLLSMIVYSGFPVDHPFRIIIQIPLGFSLSLFLPGFTFYSTLFPKKLKLFELERVIFSIGLSLVITPLISIILNFGPQGITQSLVILALIGFSLLMSGGMIFQKYRQQKLVDKK